MRSGEEEEEDMDFNDNCLLESRGRVFSPFIPMRTADLRKETPESIVTFKTYKRRSLNIVSIYFN